MRAAPLNKLVALQRPGGARDAVGGRITTWTTVAQAWASIEALSGREQLVAAQRQSEASHLIRLRFARAYAGIDATWRIVWGQTFTADAATDSLTTPGPQAWAVNDPLVLLNVGGGLPAPLVAGTTYYVKTAASDVYTLSATAGGATIDLTTAGTGTHYIAPRFFVLDQPPRNVAEANREFELICSEGLRVE